MPAESLLFLEISVLGSPLFLILSDRQQRQSLLFIRLVVSTYPV